MATLTKTQLDQIRAALLPLLQTQDNRESLVRAALWGKPVLSRIKWELAAGAFVVHLADVLDNADLADVLKEASTQVGTEGQAKLTQLVTQITSPAPNGGDHGGAPESIDRVKLRNALSSLFNMSDLESLCFDFGINAQEVDGHNVTITKFANGIVQWFEQRDRLAALVAYVRQQRPRANL